MTFDQAETRLDISRSAIASWERDGITGAAADAAKMLLAEIRILARLASEHPDLELAATAIAARYRNVLMLLPKPPAPDHDN